MFRDRVVIAAICIFNPSIPCFHMRTPLCRLWPSEPHTHCFSFQKQHVLGGAGSCHGTWTVFGPLGLSWWRQPVVEFHRSWIDHQCSVWAMHGPQYECCIGWYNGHDGHLTNSEHVWSQQLPNMDVGGLGFVAAKLQSRVGVPRAPGALQLFDHGYYNS